MVACPFCRKPVKEDLLRFGGHCPHCLIEIPGEEAATDPGEAAKAKERADAEIAQKKKKRARLPLVLALLGSVGVLSWVVFRPEPPLPEFTLEDFEMVPLSAHRDLPAIEAEAVAESNGSSAGSKKRTPRAPDNGASAERASASGGSSGGSSGASASVPVSNPEVVASNTTSSRRSTSGGSAPPPSGGPVISAGSGSQGLADPFAIAQVGPGDRGPQGIVHCKDDEVRTMVKAVVERFGSQLNQCYNTALNTNDDLRGRWKVMFTLQTDGKPGPVKVVAQKVSDAGFEDCLKRNVQKWQFGRICEPVDLNLPFNFGPK